MPLKRKNFLKMYADTMDNVTGDGVWSGRGIGVPALGAMFGGDDYKEKIGREKIPWYLSDFRGQPSMAADAGWSGISMSRVNKGYDELYEPKEMFPEQDVKESDEDDIYISRVEKKLGGERVSEFKEYLDEDYVVSEPSYTLFNSDRYLSEDVFKWRDLVPGAIEDADWRDFVPDELEDEAEEAYEYVSDLLDLAMQSGRPAYELLSDKVDALVGREGSFETLKDIAMEVGRDFIALSAAGIPIVGTPIAAAYVIYNLEELQKSQVNAMRGVDLLMTRGEYHDVNNLQTILGDMFDDYVDMLQAAVYIIPFVGATKGVLGAANSLIKGTGAKTASSFLGIGGPGVLKSAIKSEILLNPIFKFIASISDSDSDVDELSTFGINKAWFHNIIVESASTMVVLTDILEKATKQYEAWTMSGSVGEYRFDPVQLDITQSAISQAQERLAVNEYEFLIDTLIDDQMEKIKQAIGSFDTSVLDDIFEAKTMNSDLKLLRAFIREALGYSAPEGSISHPTGYLYRQPPSTDEDEDLDRLGSGKDVVNYKTDMGHVSYQPRPENLKEQALRRIIRRKLKEIKKKA